jgi:hypothetical protein
MSQAAPPLTLPISLGLALLAAGLSLGAPAHAGEVVTLDPKPKQGMRREVKESRRSTISTRWKARGGGAGTKVEIGTLDQTYEEEVLKAQPKVTLRQYSESKRSKGEKGKEAPVVKRTSLHGRSVRMVGAGLEPAEKGFEVSKEDREALKFDRLARAFVDARKVEVRDSWKLPAEPFAKALFGDWLPTSAVKGKAKVTLKSFKQKEGVRLATLKVVVSLRIERYEKLPEIHLDLKGEVVWNLDEQGMASSKLEGKISYSTVTKEGGHWDASGPLSWAYSAKFRLPRKGHDAQARKEGRPPGPGTTALVCTLDARHRIDLKHYVACIACGKKLDKAHRCPDKHPWTFQFCPHDGAALRHE